MPLSYKLHAELAKEHDGVNRWGYRTLHCGSLKADGKGQHEDGKGEIQGNGETWEKLPKLEKESSAYEEDGEHDAFPQDLDWFDKDSMKSYSEMGTPTTTAQVHPLYFTNSMVDLAVAAGAKVILGKVTAIDYVDGVRGVTYEDKETKHIHTLPATDVVLAAGPWTSHVFPEAPIKAQRAHSVVIKAEVSPYAVFSEIELPEGFGRTKVGKEGKSRRHGTTVSPEMYARPDGTVYACGLSDLSSVLLRSI